MRSRLLEPSREAGPIEDQGDQWRKAPQCDGLQLSRVDRLGGGAMLLHIIRDLPAATSIALPSPVS